MNSVLYVGAVLHRRLRPKPYQLRHSCFWLLLDIDELDRLNRRLWLFSRNRFNAVSFFDKDHGEQTGEPLRAQITRYLADANIDLTGGAVKLLCMPRIFGYGFNPLSVYFCYDRDGALGAIHYEVRNTFGERHSYLIPVTPDGAPVVRQSCDKGFYVSPFMDIAMRYEFRVAPPGKAVSVGVTGGDADGPMIVAFLNGRREPLNDLTLLKLLAKIPFLTAKVMGAIHWHALKMYLKGFRLVRKPPAPKKPVTIVGDT